MTLEEALAEIIRLREKNALYETQLASALARITDLEEKLRKNSSNSSKPPSSNPPHFQRSPKPPAGKKPGAQPGHKGHKRNLLPPQEVSHFVSHVPSHCQHCTAALTGEDSQPQKHQVVDIPPVKPTVTEHQFHTLSCQVCGKETRATLPDDVPRGSFGPRLHALAGLAIGKYRMSRRLVESFFRDIFGTTLSLGSVSNIEKELSAALEKPVADAKKYAQEQPVCNVDETGFKQKNIKSHLWVMVTSLVTIFQIWPKRDQAGAVSLLGEIKERVFGSDRYSAYGYIPVENRQVCLEHLKRDFIGLSEKPGEVGVLGTIMAENTKKALLVHREYKEGVWSQEQYETKMSAYKNEIEKSLRECAELDVAKASGMCREILKNKEAIWTFVKKPEVEPTNNAAERALRPAVIMRKLSFGTQSERGSRFMERILSVGESLRQQGRNVLEWLTSACEARLAKSQPPSLLPS